jgi:chromosome segregation ATPase
MEKKKTPIKTPANPKAATRKKTTETSKEKITKLTNSVDALSSELETLKSNIEKRNSESIALSNSVDAVSTELETLKINSQKETSADKTLKNSLTTLSSEFETLKLNIQKGKSENTAQANSVDAISSELETLKLNIQKRKSENTTLKILFYTGLIVLLLGFLYTNATLQRAQMDSMESSIQLLRNLMNKELLSVEKNVYQKIDLLEKDAGAKSKVSLQDALENMTLAISRLDTGDEKTTVLIEQVRKNTMELREAVSEHEQSR